MFDDCVVLDDAFHGTGMVKAMKVVKATVVGAVGDFASDGSRFSFVFGAEFLARFGVEIFEVEVPLSNDSGVVALFFEKACDGGTLWSDEAGSEALHDAALVFGSPVIAPGEKTVAGGSADCGAGMSVSENHPFFCKAIDGGGGDFTALRIEVLDVAVSEVITKDEDDVGFR